MALLEILKFPDPRLHLVGKKIDTVTDEIRLLVENMAQTMYENNGIGLAATQVDVQLRLLIIDISGEDEPKNLQVFINPEIIEKDGEVVSEEGCLSVPTIYEKVRRNEKIKIKYLDLNQVEHIQEWDGLMSVCLQHEIDHLDGKVFVEYLSQLKQNFIKKRLKKVFKPK